MQQRHSDPAHWTNKRVYLVHVDGIARETEKAVMVEISHGRTAWVPRSQSEFYDRDGRLAMLIPAWLWRKSIRDVARLTFAIDYDCVGAALHGWELGKRGIAA